MAPYSSNDDRDPYEILAEPPKNSYDLAKDQERELIEAIGIELYEYLEKLTEDAEAKAPSRV